MMRQWYLLNSARFQLENFARETATRQEFLHNYFSHSKICCVRDAKDDDTTLKTTRKRFNPADSFLLFISLTLVPVLVLLLLLLQKSWPNVSFFNDKNVIGWITAIVMCCEQIFNTYGPSIFSLTTLHSTIAAWHCTFALGIVKSSSPIHLLLRLIILMRRLIFSVYF